MLEKLKRFKFYFINHLLFLIENSCILYSHSTATLNQILNYIEYY